MAHDWAISELVVADSYVTTATAKQRYHGNVNIRSGLANAVDVCPVICSYASLY